MAISDINDAKLVLLTGDKNIVDMIFATNLNKLYIPDSVYVYYLFAEYFFTYMSIGAAITKLARFPISNLDSVCESAVLKKAAKKIQRKIKLKEKLVKIGINYFLYGSSYVIPTFPIRKTIICRSCGKTYQLMKLEKNGIQRYTFVNGDYKFKCTNKKCKWHKQERAFRVEDRPIKDISKMSLALWSPLNMEINENTVTGQLQYLYKLDKTMVNKISRGDHFTLCTTPEMYIKAALGGYSIKVNSDKMFVLHAPTLKIKGIPIPPMVMAMNDLILRTKYLTANRTISEDLLVPLRMLFPINKGEVGQRPLTQQLRTVDWVTKTRSELDKWEKDKSHIITLPIEIGSKDAWGQGKLLAMHQELKANMSDILSTMDMPIEFFYGGAVWSRHNVSAIIMENTFKQYATLLQDILDYIADEINKKKITSDILEMKINTPRLVDAMAEGIYLERGLDKGDISPQTYYDRFNISYPREMQIIDKNREMIEGARQDRAKGTALAEAKAQESLLNVQEKIRSFERVENLKDGIAQGRVEEDSLNRNIKAQKELALLNAEIQKEIIRANASIMSKQMKEQSSDSIKNMEIQLKLQSDEEYKNAQKMQKLEVKGMKDQARAEDQIMAEREGNAAKKQITDIFESLPPEIKEEITKLPPEEQEPAIMQYGEQQKKQETLASLPEEERESIQDLPEKEQDQRLGELTQGQEEEGQPKQETQEDPGLGKEKIKQKLEAEKEEEGIDIQATALNKLQGQEREVFKAKLIQEDSKRFAQIKEVADMMFVQDVVNNIMEADPKDAEAIYEEVKKNRPELAIDVYKELERQLFYQHQSNGWALRLLQTEGTPEQEELVGQLRKDTPKQFRQMVFQNYQQLSKVPAEKRETYLDKAAYANDRRNDMAKELAASISAFPEDERKKLLGALKHENPELYKNTTYFMEE